MKLGSVSGLITIAPDADPILGRIDRAAELGLQVISIGFRDSSQRSADYMRQVADRAAQRGVELRLGGGGRFGSADTAERRAEVDRVITYLLEVNRYTGITFSSLANGPMSQNRWSPVPPMDERIGIIAESLAAVADGVASAGIVLGLENHCDYRGYECAAMLAKANRPNLKAQIDTGNAFTVFEDPVDCARAMAKWVVSAHFKDVQVIPLAGAPHYGSRCIDCVFGQGHVDLVTITGILQAEAPDPANLTLMIEPLTLPPDVDRGQYLDTALAWCREKLAAYL